jgi:hypothetical protein
MEDLVHRIGHLT